MIKTKTEVLSLLEQHAHDLLNDNKDFELKSQLPDY